MNEERNYHAKAGLHFIRTPKGSVIVAAQEGRVMIELAPNEEKLREALDNGLPTVEELVGSVPDAECPER